jgi:hypothetical protein
MPAEIVGSVDVQCCDADDRCGRHGDSVAVDVASVERHPEQRQIHQVAGNARPHPGRGLAGQDAHAGHHLAHADEPLEHARVVRGPYANQT